MIRLILIRSSLLVAGLSICLMSIGCCGPMGCGPGCGDMSCYDCDGTAGRTIPNGPLDGMRQFKRNLVCGGGCGEAYYGEWRSTPPDACDPCCDDQWVGGATACRPFCWQPGSLLASCRGLYGGRFCSGAESSASCCETVCDSGCGGCGDCGGEVYGGEVITGGGCSSCGGGGCATCANTTSGGNTRMARMPAKQTIQNRIMDARINRIRR